MRLKHLLKLHEDYYNELARFPKLRALGCSGGLLHTFLPFSSYPLSQMNDGALSFSAFYLTLMCTMLSGTVHGLLGLIMRG